MSRSSTRQAWWQRLWPRLRHPRETAGGRAAAEAVALAAAGPGRALAPDPQLPDYESCYARCDDVYAAVSLLADNAARVPLQVRRRGEAVPGHPLQGLLERLNPWQGAEEFWTRAYSHLWLTGECFLLVERNDPLEPDLANELWAFSGRVLEPVADPDTYLSHYRFRPPGRSSEAGFRVAPRDVVPLTLFHPLRPLRGLSPLSSLRLGLAAELHAKRANVDLFANGLMADVALTFEFANDEQRRRTREALRETHVGDGRRHGFLILENTTRIEPLSLTPRDAEFVELDKLTTRDVAKAYRIPPMFLAQLDHATLRNFETAYRALWELAILPRVRQVAAALTEHLASQWDDDLVVEPDVTGIDALRVDDRERIACFHAMRAAGLDADWAGRRVFGTDWDPAAVIGPPLTQPDAAAPVAGLAPDDSIEADGELAATGLVTRAEPAGCGAGCEALCDAVDPGPCGAEDESGGADVVDKSGGAGAVDESGKTASAGHDESGETADRLVRRTGPCSEADAADEAGEAGAGRAADGARWEPAGAGPAPEGVGQ